MLVVTLQTKRITWEEQTWEAIVNEVHGDSIQFRMMCQISRTVWPQTKAVKELAGADCRQIVSDSSAGNYWIIEAFQSLALEWEVFERRLYEVLNPVCCFCFPKQTDMPSLQKELSTLICLAWDLRNLWIFHDHKLSTSFLASDPHAATNCCFLWLLKVYLWVSGNRLGQQSTELPPADHVSWQSIFWSVALRACSMWGHFGIYPPAFTPFSPPSAPLLPFHPLIGVMEPQRGGEGVTGSKSFPLWISRLAGRSLAREWLH